MRCLLFSVLLLRVTVHIFVWETLKNTAVVGLELVFLGHRRAENKTKGIGGFKVTSSAKWKPGEVNREPTRTNQILSGQGLPSFKTLKLISQGPARGNWVVFVF